MKKLCFCLKIHIPAPALNYRFYNIKQHHNYFEEDELEKHVHKICSENLLSFLFSIKRLSAESGGKLKFGISISGRTLTLLKKFSQPAMELLFELAYNHCFEFLSEPWSQSVLPYVDPNALICQTDLHDQVIFNTFQKVPKIFIVHSPVNSPKLAGKVLKLGKEGVLTYANQIRRETLRGKDHYRINIPSVLPHFLINQKISGLFQECDFNAPGKSLNQFYSLAFMDVKRNSTGNYPLIILYNPTMSNCMFDANRTIIWEAVVRNMLNDPLIDFMLPSDLLGKFSNSDIVKNVPAKFLSRYVVPDYWIKNSLQKETCKRLLEINSLVQVSTNKMLEDNWRLVQDMDYLYYMSSFFLMEKFAENYYNPFNSPYLAYISYMNVLDDFYARVHEKPIKMKKSQHSWLN